MVHRRLGIPERFPVVLLLLFSPFLPHFLHAQSSLLIENSPAGISSQVDQFCSTFRERRRDKTAMERLRGSFLLPDPDAWFNGHFEPDDAKRLASEYTEWSKGFMDEWLKAMAEVGIKRMTASPVPLPPSSLSRFANAPALKGAAEFQVSRLCLLARGNRGSCFSVVLVYEGGSFRIVGFRGFPFWAKPRVLEINQQGIDTQIRRVSVPAIPYPSLAVQTGISGVVEMTGLLDVGGSIGNLTILSGHPLLVQSALDSVRLVQLQPVVVEQEPVLVVLKIKVSFVRFQEPTVTFAPVN